MTFHRAIHAGLLALMLLAGLRVTPAGAETFKLDTTFEEFTVRLDRSLHRVMLNAPNPFCGPGTNSNPLCGLEEFYRCLMTPADMGCGSINFVFRQQAAGGDLPPEDFTWRLRAVEFTWQALEHPNLNLVLIDIRERYCWGDGSSWLWQPDWRLVRYIVWWTKNQRWEIVAAVPPLPLMRNRSQALSKPVAASKQTESCGGAQ